MIPGETPRDPVAAAEGYARDVVAGRIPAGRLTVAACRRHLDDLERARSPGQHPQAELLPHQAPEKWMAARTAWMDLDAWERCRDETWQPQPGDPCSVAMDLASKNDVAATVALFYRDLPVEKNGRPKLD